MFVIRWVCLLLFWVEWCGIGVWCVVLGVGGDWGLGVSVCGWSGFLWRVGGGGEWVLVERVVGECVLVERVLVERVRVGSLCVGSGGGRRVWGGGGSEGGAGAGM